MARAIRLGLLALAVACSEPATPSETLCTVDKECEVDQTCNSFGRCQPLPRCRRNGDCTDGAACDTVSGRCRPLEECFNDVHCPAGTVCETERCVAGCRDTGDCTPGMLCREGACEEGCRDRTDCRLTQVCAAGRCFDDPNESHCAPCDVDRVCPARRDFCLLNPAYDPARPSQGAAYQCGVECEDDPAVCPHGFVCAPVVRLTQELCEEDLHCGGLDRHCVIEEGDPSGFCTCVRDLDCLPDSRSPRCTFTGLCEFPAGRLCGDDADCDPLPLCGRHGGAAEDVCWTSRTPCDGPADCLCVDGTCETTQRPCDSAADCALTCDDGRCRVGAACKPIEGLYCPDLR